MYVCDLHSSWSTDSVVNSHPPNPSLFAFPTLFGWIVWMSFYQSSKVNRCLVFPSLTLSSYPAYVFRSFLEPCSLARVCSCSVFVSFSMDHIDLLLAANQAFWSAHYIVCTMVFCICPHKQYWGYSVPGTHKYKYTQTQWQIQNTNSTNESFTTACTTTCVKLLHSHDQYISAYGWILLKNTFVTLPSGLFSC